MRDDSAGIYTNDSIHYSLFQVLPCVFDGKITDSPPCGRHGRENCKNIGASVKAAQLLAGEHVEVDVMDGLPGQLADVRYHTVAVGKAHFPGKLGNDSIDVADHGFIFRRDLSGGGKMLLRDDEEMCGGKGADVLEGIDRKSVV